MPDRYGRPQFSDWLGMSQAFLGLGEHMRQKQEAQHQKKVKDDAYKVFSALSQDPGMEQKEPGALTQELGVDPEAAQKGRVLYYTTQQKKNAMSRDRLEAKKAKTDALYQEARQAFTQADTARQSGDQGGFLTNMATALNAYPDGYDYEVIEADKSGGTPGGPAQVKVTSPLGKSKVIGMDEMEKRYLSVKENPARFAPEQFFAQENATAETVRNQNAKWALDPEKRTDKDGNTVWVTKMIDPKTRKPRLIYTDKNPVADPNHKVLDAKDIEGHHAADTWKALQEAERERAEVGKINAETDYKKAQAEALRTGQGGDAPANVKEANFVVGFLKQMPENEGMSDAEITKKAYDIVKAKSGQTKEQFTRETAQRLMETSFGSKTPQDATKEAKALANELYGRDKRTLGGGQQGAMDEKPPAADHKGRTIVDTVTGKKLKSNGKEWVEVK